MSDLRIALVAEGPTDYAVIHAALKAVLPETFVMTQLQPEATQPDFGRGWGGVLKWCHAAGQRNIGPLDTDPTLASFDLLIIHLDMDVASKQYADNGHRVEAMAQTWNWSMLPCMQPCPPVADTSAQLEAVLKSWLGQASPGNRTLFCLPAQSSDTWLAAAVQSPDHPLLADGECDITVVSKLAQLPKDQRIRKTVREYRHHSPHITKQWNVVKQICGQAQQFEHLVLSGINP